MTAQIRAQREIRKIRLPIRSLREVRLQHEIYKIRRELGLSQTAFGELLGVSQKAISSWEDGSKSPIFCSGLLLHIWWNGSIEAALIANRVMQVAFNE